MKQIILALIFVSILTNVFATDYDYQVSGESINGLDISDIDTFGSLISWRCNMNSVPTMFQIGSCYCLDTKGGPLDLIGSDGLGYGNLFECLKETTIGSFKTSSIFGAILDFRISTKIDQSISTPQSITIGKSDSELVCEHASTTYLPIYTFFRENPFQVLSRGLSNTTDIPSYLQTGNEVKCQVSLYNGWTLIGSEVSSNSYTHSDNSLLLNDVYLAPAYPETGDTLYCYGRPHYNLDGNIYNVTHKFDFYNNGNLVETDSFIDEDGLSETYIGDYTGFAKGEDVYCVYILELHNSTDLVKSIDLRTDDVVINNARPEIPALGILMT